MNGILLIADISGYTQYLAGSELEHAQDSLRTLLKLVVEHTRPPLVISRLEGDAVISYAPDGSFVQGQTIVEIIERTYVDFCQARELMRLNTTCTCNACRNIPNLDLKFLVHYGSFVLEPLLSYTELVGTDVNLVHRLTKNSIVEQTGIKAYAAYTQSAVSALGIEQSAESMPRHVEAYESIGEVQLYLVDLRSKWEEVKAQKRTSVQEGKSMLMFEDEYPLPPLMMWDIVTSPRYKAILSGSKSARVDHLTNGRIGPGAVYYCAHGNGVSAQTIVDWRPPREFTWVGELMWGVSTINTLRLSPADGGTQVAQFGAMAGGGRLIRWLLMAIFGPFAALEMKRFSRELRRQLEIDLSEKRLLEPGPGSFEADERLNAAGASDP